MLKRVLLYLLALAGGVSAGCSSLTIPTDYLTVDKWRRAGEAANWTATKNAHDGCADSLNNGPLARITNWTTNLTMASLQNLALKIDSDNNGTHKFALLNGGGDSLFRVNEDSTAKFFGNLTVAGTTTLTGAPTFSSLTASLPVFADGSKALTSNTMTGTGSVVMSASPTLTGTLAAANGTYSGTLGVTGLHTASGGILIQTGGNGIGRLAYQSESGVQLRGSTGSLYDLALLSSGGGYLFGNPTGTNDVAFPGAVSMASTLGATGEITASGGILFATGGGGAGRIYRSAVDGLIARAVTGSSNDFALISAAGNILVSNPVGSANLTVGYDAGAVTIPGTATTTGKHTFTAAPRYSSVTASEFLLVDGSKDLTSVAGTGTGSVMRAVSPATTGTLTAAAITASGNVTADSLISSKFYAEGTYTATLAAGCTTTPTGTVSYVRAGKMVTQCFPTGFSCTSNSTSLEISGTPASIYPAGGSASIARVAIPVVNNGTVVIGRIQTSVTYTDGWRFSIIPPAAASNNEMSLTGFTNSGTKGFDAGCFTYTLQ